MISVCCRSFLSSSSSRAATVWRPCSTSQLEDGLLARGALLGERQLVVGAVDGQELVARRDQATRDEGLVEGRDAARNLGLDA